MNLMKTVSVIPGIDAWSHKQYIKYKKLISQISEKSILP